MLKFKEYGNKENPTVILLHGAGVLHTFSHQLELASRYHLVIPELPGAGDLAGRLFDPEWTDNALLDLVRRLGGEPVILAGHSLGAQIALRFALCHPELTVKAAILSAWINPRTRLSTDISRWPDLLLLCCTVPGWSGSRGCTGGCLTMRLGIWFRNPRESPRRSMPPFSEIPSN